MSKQMQDKIQALKDRMAKLAIALEAYRNEKLPPVEFTPRTELRRNIYYRELIDLDVSFIGFEYLNNILNDRYANISPKNIYISIKGVRLILKEAYEMEETKDELELANKIAHKNMEHEQMLKKSNKIRDMMNEYKELEEDMQILEKYLEK